MNICDTVSGLFFWFFCLPFSAAPPGPKSPGSVSRAYVRTRIFWLQTFYGGGAAQPEMSTWPQLLLPPCLKALGWSRVVITVVSFRKLLYRTRFRTVSSGILHPLKMCHARRHGMLLASCGDPIQRRGRTRFCSPPTLIIWAWVSL